jgi:serpin B
MRLLLLIALFVAVASANYGNQNRFNRLLRQMQRQQQQQQGYGTQGYNTQGWMNECDYDSDEQDDDDNYFQQQQQQQCRRNQRYQNQDLDDDEYDQYQGDDQDLDDQFQGPYGQSLRGQGRQQQQHKRQQQQQQHQCRPKFNLLQALEEANSQLASKLYEQAKQENDDKNTVVSPTAVQLALAAIKRGARGNTQRQIQRVLNAGLTKQQAQQAHAALQQSLQGQDPIQHQTGQMQRCQIKTTTTIVVNQKNHAQQRFIKAVKACTNTQVKKCNFQHQPKQCRQQINRLVAQKTNHKLQQIVPQDAVTTNTKMIVVSTTQLKARWGSQFRQQQQTKQGRFHPLGNQQPKTVQMLQSQGQFNYFEDAQLQVVGVPTQQQEMTLYVIVPKDKDGLNQIEKEQIQNGQQLKQLLEQADLQQEQVDVELPKIQIKHKIDAKQTLRKQGVRDCFDADQADLSGISGQQQGQQQWRRGQQYQDEDDEDQYQQDQDQDEQQQRQQQLHVNKLIHQATIKIDEQGINAARSQNQYQQQDQYDDQDDEDEQGQLYRQQQDDRQELYEEIFAQRQGQGRGQRRHRRQSQFQTQQGQIKVKANRAFAFAIKHNPSNQIVLVGRVVDAAQKPQGQQGNQQIQQSLHGVDQQ